MSTLDPTFYAAFPPPVRDLLVTALRDAYIDAGEDYHAESGGDAQLYGLTVYKYATHRIAELAKTSPAVLASVVCVPSLPFEARIGDYTFGCYRVGEHASDDIMVSFPNNDCGAARLVRQPYLPGVEPDVQSMRELVLAHMGNSEDGLQAVYLCFPIRVEDDRIVEWGHAELLWRDESGDAVLPAAAGLPRDEDVPYVDVRRKEKRDQHDAAQ